MTNFLALYRGESIDEASIIGVSLNPQLISFAALEMMLTDVGEQNDPILRALHEGRQRALRQICVDNSVIAGIVGITNEEAA